jgi:uncharacterized protein (TIGR03437 family)
MVTKRAPLVAVFFVLVGRGFCDSPLRTSLAALNEEIVRAAGSSYDLTPLISQRSALMSELIRRSPHDAPHFALPRATSEKLQASYPALASDLESATAMEGNAVWIAADDFQRGTGETVLRLTSGDDEVMVHGAGELGVTIRNNMRVRVRGLRIRNVFAADEVSVMAAPPADTGCSTTGPQHVVVLLVTYPGFQTTLSPVHARSTFFSPNGWSVATFYKEASQGHASITGDVYGWFTLDRVYDVSRESNVLVRAAVDAAVGKVAIADGDRVMVVFPWRAVINAAAAFSSIGCYSMPVSNGTKVISTSWFNALGMTDPVQGVLYMGAHELGHALGLPHANSLTFLGETLGPVGGSQGKLTEYGDPFAVMAMASGHFNGREQQQLGWLQAGTDVLDVTAPGVYTVRPISLPGSGIKALRIRRAPGEWVWVEYRQPGGLYESQVAAGAFAGASLFYEGPGVADAAGAGNTAFLDATPGTSALDDGTLTAGRDWRDPYTGMHIEVLAATSEALVVRVNDPPRSCATLAAATADQPVSGGTGAIAVTAPSTCQWRVDSLASWISITSAQTASGAGSVAYRAEAATGGRPRSAALVIDGQVFTVSQQAVNVAPGPPFAFSPSQRFSPSTSVVSIFPDENGWADIATGQVLIADQSSGPGCLFEYNYRNGNVRLGDGTGGWTGPVNESLAGQLSNRYCHPRFAYGGGSIYFGNANMELELDFDSAFAGNKRVFLNATDRAGLSSGWVQGPDYTVFSNPMPRLTATGIVNAASFLPGPVAPGEMVTIFGTDLGPSTLFSVSYQNGHLPYVAAGTSVQFDSALAPLIYTQAGQVSAVVPYEATGNPLLTVGVNGVSSNAVTPSTAGASPGIFCYNAGKGAAVAVNTNPDGTFAYNVDQAAVRGGYLTFFLTGEGATLPPAADGTAPVYPNNPKPALPVHIFLGGVESTCATNWIGQIYAGVTQVNACIPPNAPTGLTSLRVNIGGVDSQPGVTINIR